MKKGARWLLMLLLPAAAAFYILSRPEPPEHIFLITLDTTRADAVDYAPGNPRTPNLAALAAAGQRWSNAYSVIPITLPSHAAMLYSVPPHVLKLYNNGQERKTHLPALAELMKQKGYATGAVVSLAVLNRDFGLARGFDHYLENFAPNLWYRSAADVNRDAFALIASLKKSKSFIWLHYSDPHEPYFVPGAKERFTVSLGERVLYSGPSTDQPNLSLPIDLPPGESVILLQTEVPAPLAAGGGFTGVTFSNLQLKTPEPGAGIAMATSPDLQRRSERYGSITLNTTATRSRLVLNNRGPKTCSAELAFKYQLKTSPEAKRSGYEQEVRYLDAQIGLLLAHLKDAGLYERSAFLVMGDHGEGLGEYGSHYGHIHYLNKVYTHVPFILCGPNIPRGKVRGDLVSNFEVAPTLLALAGAKKLKHMAGVDLTSGKGHDKLFLETYSPEAYFDAFATVYFPWQVIFYPGRPGNSLEFYNLERDRLGTVNLHAGADPSGRRSEMTNSVLKVSRIITANKRRQASLNQKTMDKLRSLGYL